MNKLFRRHPEAVLITLAVLFLIILFVFISWTIGDVVGQTNRAANAIGGGGQSVNYDLQGARSLDLRGLVKTQP